MAEVVDTVQDTPHVDVESERYPLKHLGFGKYEVDGTKYNSKAEALKAQARLNNEADLQENVYGDVLPAGYEDIVIRDRSLVYRGTLLEVPMNEVYLPDGDFNPMYDRAWYYAWARRGPNVAAYRAVKYEIVTHEVFKDLVNEGKAPAHYLSMLQRDGDHLMYGDLVLMRTPRVYWRQRKVEEAARSAARLDKTQKLASESPHVVGVSSMSVGPN